ncbi:MAG: LamG domain-containing protein [Pseudomonadota bacterium]
MRRTCLLILAVWCVSACTAALGPAQSHYDALVLSDRPVAYWALHGDAREPDLTGHQHQVDRYGAPSSTSLPNGERAARFDGADAYFSARSDPAFSVTTTGMLTWEAWIRPDVVDFPRESTDGYVDFMGKCATYAPSCEWEARLYGMRTPQGRCGRISAYIFNSSAGLGSAADWQPECSAVRAAQWLYVVGGYDLTTRPADCPDTQRYPGSIEIWVNGARWNSAPHRPTGCMSQYAVSPRAGSSPLLIGTMARDTWFKGAIAKVAIYDRLLTQAEIERHFQAMTGRAVTAHCAVTCTP